jgi:hypothetical protein
LTGLIERAQRRIARTAGDRGATMDFEIVCPNDHNQTVTFSHDDFEAELKSGALVFHCNTCDTNWPPSHEAIAKIRKQLSKNSSGA